jgi:hypothetical protein
MVATDLDHVFVIRLEWEEDGPVSDWRARITYVNSRQRFYASGVDEAFGIIRSLLSVAASDDGEMS